MRLRNNWKSIPTLKDWFILKTRALRLRSTLTLTMKMIAAAIIKDWAWKSKQLICTKFTTLLSNSGRERVLSSHQNVLTVAMKSRFSLSMTNMFSRRKTKSTTLVESVSKIDKARLQLMMKGRTLIIMTKKKMEASTLKMSIRLTMTIDKAVRASNKRSQERMTGTYLR